MPRTLWTRNFTIITLGTVISAIGGVAMSFALSFVVFDNTGSTLLMGIFSAVSLLPHTVIPVLAAPYLDNFRRKPVIVGLDYFNGCVYLLMGVYLLSHSFQMGLYLAFSLLVNTTGAIYQLAYNSLYPNLIPQGFAQKGYTVSGMLYPTVIMVMTPAASVLYASFGLPVICIGEGGLLLLAATVETQIRVEETAGRGGRFSFRDYLADFREGFHYLSREKGLLRIYTYMPLTQGLSNGTSNLVTAYFRTTPGLDMTMYAFFTTVEFIGRTLGGLVHYRFTIPPKRRFSLAYLVYQIYSVMDALLLWLPYPLMLANRALCGFLGINSATLRESSVQNYLPDNMRAKVNAVFNALMSLSSLVFSLGVGALGEVVDYRAAMTILNLVLVTVCWWVMWRGRADVKTVYDRPV